jgi:CRISPR-associated protein Csd1
LIIQALDKYYRLLKEDEASDIPSPGFSIAKVDFALLISLDGDLVDILPLKEEKVVRNRTRIFSRELIVPEQVKRTKGIFPYFLCDKSQYVLGLDDKGGDKRTKNAHKAFVDLHNEVLTLAEGRIAKAVLNFLENWSIEDYNQNELIKDNLDELLAASNLVFIVKDAGGKYKYAHENEEIKKLWYRYQQQDQDDISMQCLVTGLEDNIARVHPSIKGVKDAQTSGAAIVSFNNPAYLSYNKDQSYNAPISKTVSFTYTTVLNKMLASNSQKISIGDTTTVFWAESPSDLYVDIASMLLGVSGKEKKVDTQTESIIQSVMINIASGRTINLNEIHQKLDPNVKFHILGLAPNAGRISIRYYYADKFGAFVESLRLHKEDISLLDSYGEMKDIPIWKVLDEIVSKKSRDKTPNPLISGAFMRAVLTGGMYPVSLLTAILSRIKVEVDDKDNHVERINYNRAALIKAYIKRKSRITNNNKYQEVLTMSLNNDSNEVAYLLGRLFAALEKTQLDVSQGLNTTIKDRYFTSAATNPGKIFPLLLKLSQHHLNKSDYKFSSEKRIEDLLGRLNGFPSYLNLEDQGIFMLGYYHQKSAFYVRKEKES